MENENKWYFKKLPTRGHFLVAAPNYRIYSGGFVVANVFPTMATGKGFDYDVKQIIRDHNAAPDMLEALKCLLNNFKAMGGKCGIEQAEAAISKALGE